MISRPSIKASLLDHQFEAGTSRAARAPLLTYLRSSIKEFDDQRLVKYIYNKHLLHHRYGCQQQPICEPEPHHCRFLYCLTFRSVQSNISSWYIMLNEFQSYKNFLSWFWQQWILIMELCAFICAYLANSIAYSPKMHNTAPLSMNCPLMRMGKMKKFATTVLTELQDSLTCLMYSSVIVHGGEPSHLPCHTHQPSPKRQVSGNDVNVTV